MLHRERRYRPVLEQIHQRVLEQERVPAEDRALVQELEQAYRHDEDCHLLQMHTRLLVHTQRRVR